MVVPYTNQNKAKRQLRPGQEIIYSQNGKKEASGTVVRYETYPHTQGVVELERLNADNIILELSSVKLFRKLDWENVV